MNHEPPIAEPPAAAEGDVQRQPRRPRKLRLGWVVVALIVLNVTLFCWLASWEMRSSTLQARFLVPWTQEMHFEVRPGPSPANRYPHAGPFDRRRGYTRIPEFVERSRARDYVVTAQARQSPALADFIENGFNAPYIEKAQAGLDVEDCRAEPLFHTRHPQYAYPSFDAVPPLLAQTLAFIENRELLQAAEPKHNPALEWTRLGRALLDQAIAVVSPDHPAAGGSTLATQLEKFRHSPEGRTASVSEKARQVVSASMRAYLGGPETGAARQRILLDYVNSVPLGALRGYGEINGILDGLRAWYGADVAATNRALWRAAGSELPAQALALRQVLGLMIAQRRPAFFFAAGQDRLAASIDGYLRVLAQEGIIGAALRDAALQSPLTLRTAHDARDLGTQVTDQKAASLLRLDLASLLATPNLYDLDRLDLSAASSIDGRLQTDVTELLARLRKPGEAAKAGLVGRFLLERGDPAGLYYSFTLYERGDDGVNRLRVQTDNLDQPFDINTGAKLELGSTAKLRTLATYLEIIASLHARLAALPRAELAAEPAARRDRLTRWAVDYLSSARDRSLQAMLDAAMERRYSASPNETFFTGGGAHRFQNFEASENGSSPSLRDALRDSVNLAFVRLMRDIVYHYMYGDPGAAATILEDDANPRREVLLARFADREGSQFMRGFYRKLRGFTPDEALDRLADDVHATPARLAVIYRSVAPAAPLTAFSAFVTRHLPSSTLSPASLLALYERYAPGRFSLPDQGYLARVHPLELWVAAYLREHPQAPLTQVLEAGAAQRQEVYGWLFRTRSKSAQDTRIATLLEIDAFVQIQRSWQRLGYPFDHLVPSYATALGSSGDRPAALAELMGIIVNGGVRNAPLQLEALRLAAATPFETRLQRQAGAGERVMAPEVAATLQRALARVVEEGTARRLRGAFDAAGKPPIIVGGKTGTGDNRLNTYGARGALTGSQVLNRTATFVFYIGARHFGTLTAYVPGRGAADYRFTSALPVQILRTMAPLLQPLLAGGGDAGCGTPALAPISIPTPDVASARADASIAPPPAGAAVPTAVPVASRER